MRLDQLSFPSLPCFYVKVDWGGFRELEEPGSADVSLFWRSIVNQLSNVPFLIGPIWYVENSEGLLDRPGMAPAMFTKLMLLGV